MQTLLLADDNTAIQRFVELTFADLDVRVVAVNDGEAALQQLLTDPPDIVLAALGLAKVNGFEVARFVRQAPGLQGVPVLLVAGAGEPVDEARVREAGIAGVLFKPFEPDVVTDRVMDLLRRKATSPGVWWPADTGDAAGASERTVIGRPRMWEPSPPMAASADAATPWRHGEVPDYRAQLDATMSLDATISLVGTSAVDEAPPAVDDTVVAATATLPADSTNAMNDDRFTHHDPANAGDDPQAASQTEWNSTATMFGAAAPPPTVVGGAPLAHTAADSSLSTARPSAPANGVADAFAALLAEEQGEAVPAPAPASEHDGEFSDAAIDRLADRVAARVAERVAHGLGTELTRIVGDVAERLVREEIARLRRRS